MTAKRGLDAIPPAAGGVVMGTGIVSTALLMDRQQSFSRILLAVAAGIWIALAAALAIRVLRDPHRVRLEARSPAALTGVAGTSVLGVRVTVLGWRWAGVVTLAIAVVLWLLLLKPVLRSWSTPTLGISLMLAVSTESLAVLAATLASRGRGGWLLYAACALFLLGIVAYVSVIACFDFRELLAGRGDQWITGGALAISALAGAQITLAAHDLHQMVGLWSALETASLVLWVLTIVWLPVLVATEAARPRLAYDLRRWSTVFPVGMYAACSFAVGVAAHSHSVSDFAKIWVWVSLALWMVVSAAALGRVGRSL